MRKRGTIAGTISCCVYAGAVHFLKDKHASTEGSPEVLHKPLQL